MQILVTGATGLVGNALVHALTTRGDRVRALVRNETRARSMLSSEVEICIGDVTEPSSLDPALRDVERVFHAAGMPEQWQRDDAIFDRVNRQGTVNVLQAAERARVSKVIVTSTMDVFAAQPGGTLVETNLDPNPKPTAYERSKQAAEHESMKFLDRGLDVVFVNPGSVYGPSPVVGTVNALVKQVVDRKLPLVPPGGFPLAYIDGVTHVHLAAADRAKKGERYLVGDEYVSVRALVEKVCELTKGVRVPPNAPVWLMKALSAVSAPLARLFGFKPLVAPGELNFLLWDIRMDTAKAQRELGLVPTPIDVGLQKTIDWLQSRKPPRAAAT